MGTGTWWKALLRELGGLAVVVLVAALVLVPLFLAVKATQRRIRAERETASAAVRQQATSVVVTVLEPVVLEDRIRLPGMVAPLRDVTVAAEVAGRVVERPVPEGATVEAGQVICRLEDADYQIAVRRAAAAVRLAEADLARVRALAEQQVAPTAELDRAENACSQARAELQAAELALSRCRIVSPLSGVLDEMVPEVGERVAVADRVARVLDIARVKIEIGIPERELAAVRDLQECEVRVDAVGGGQTFRAARTYLSSETMADALVYRLRLELDNPGGRLLPGMFVDAQVLRETRPQALLVPLFAVVARDDGYVAFVVEDEGAGEAGDRRPVARLRPVTIGVIQGRQVEVRAGLRAGERLIVLGQRAVEDGTPVAVERTVTSLAELMR